jgi:hypothetical protein
MKIIHIFGDSLYSFQYDHENLNEFEQLFDNWQDPEFLEQFFTKNEADLTSGFFGSISIEDAALKTNQEANRLEKKLLSLANSNKQSLDDIFKPLHKAGHDIGSFSSSKAYGDISKSWLRVYALKIENGVYVVTGGAIKLTKTLEEREHTKLELQRIDRCKAFLKEQGIDNIDGIVELVWNN